MLDPSIRKPLIWATKSEGRAADRHSDRNVRCGSAFETTVSASISSPPASTTPTARSPSTLTDSTSASVRIVAPASRAASAMASVTLPIPPSTKPHWRIPPSGSPEAWSCSST